MSGSKRIMNEYLNKVICGDCLSVMKQIPDNSIDLICTDPPYGYSFMGKDWDKVVVSVEKWKECLRVLKPGAFAFIMSAPRQDVLSHMIVNLEQAGFQTGFTSILHCYASGFPKAQNIEKFLTKRFNYGNMLVYEKSKEIPELSMQEVWKTLIYKTSSYGKSNNRTHLQEMLADLEQNPQCKVTIKSITREKTQISERQKQSFLEGWGDISKKERELWTCKICKMPTGIYINGKKRWLCYVSQISNGKITWQSIDKNGMCSSYQSQPTRQFNPKFEIVCEQCKTQILREMSGSFSGFQPKPAYEIILVVMKPLSEKTYVDQAMNNKKGITWLDDGRIPFENTANPATNPKHRQEHGYKQPPKGKSGGVTCFKSSENEQNIIGRFPANLLISDDILDNGLHKSGDNCIRKQEGMFVEHKFGGKNSLQTTYGDAGSFSRYFSLDAWFKEKLKDLSPAVQKVFPFLIVPKASKSEKNEGLESREEQQVNDGRNILPDNAFQRGKTFRKNTHPTCKPLKLMSYLITIGSREKDIVLDPFAGSCTTGVACIGLNRQYIMCEKEKEYFEIGKTRLDYAQSQLKLI